VVHQRRVVTARLMGSEFVPGSGLFRWAQNSSLGRDLWVYVRPRRIRPWVGTSVSMTLGRELVYVRPRTH
jgi:hypothetical protein